MTSMLRSLAPTVCMFAIAFAGCTDTPLPPVDGQTTTTYGNNTSNTTFDDDGESGDDTGGGVPGA